MNYGFILLCAISVVLFAVVVSRDPGALKPVIGTVRRQLSMMLVRLPFAVIAAAYLGQIIPPDAVASFLGEDGGFRGVVIASSIGAIVPGGPVMMFPLALVLWRAGAGDAQMVAFLSGWTVIALHRSLTFEIPLVGSKFALFRLAVSWVMPLLAGAIALGLTELGLH